MNKFLIAVVLLGASILGTIGCNSSQQQSIAALVQTVGTAAASIETIQGNTVIANQLVQDTNAASTAVLNWKQGTSPAMAIEAMKVVQADLNLIPVNVQDQALINLALGAVENIITIVSTNTNSTPSTTSDAHLRIVHLENPPKTAKAFKKLWNGLIKQHPEFKTAKL